MDAAGEGYANFVGLVRSPAGESPRTHRRRSGGSFPLRSVSNFDSSHCARTASKAAAVPATISEAKPCPSISHAFRASPKEPEGARVTAVSRFTPAAAAACEATPRVDPRSPVPAFTPSTAFRADPGALRHISSSGDSENRDLELSLCAVFAPEAEATPGTTSRPWRTPLSAGTQRSQGRPTRTYDHQAVPNTPAAAAALLEMKTAPIPDPDVRAGVLQQPEQAGPYEETCPDEAQPPQTTGPTAKATPANATPATPEVPSTPAAAAALLRMSRGTPRSFIRGILSPAGSAGDASQTQRRSFSLRAGQYPEAIEEETPRRLIRDVVHLTGGARADQGTGPGVAGGGRGGAAAGKNHVSLAQLPSHSQSLVSKAPPPQHGGGGGGDLMVRAVSVLHEVFMAACVLLALVLMACLALAQPRPPVLF